jgi:hypothetical protein
VFKVYIVRKPIENTELVLHENNFLYYLKHIGTRKFPNLLPFQKVVNFTDRTAYQPGLKPEEAPVYGPPREFLAVAR